MSLTQDVLEQAEALLAGAGKPDARKLQNRRQADRSLDPALWVDGNHLDAKHGHQVFDRQREAVGKLMELLKSKDSAIPDATLQGMIDTLVQADQSGRGRAADATAASAIRASSPRRRTSWQGQPTPAAAASTTHDTTAKPGSGRRATHTTTEGLPERREATRASRRRAASGRSPSRR